MNIIFTDIDGVLNPNWSNIWNKKCVAIYNKICKEFNLIPVITSTWRMNYTFEKLQDDLQDLKAKKEAIESIAASSISFIVIPFPLSSSISPAFTE